jgi:hypothetical protein
MLLDWGMGEDEVPDPAKIPGRGVADWPVRHQSDAELPPTGPKTVLQGELRGHSGLFLGKFGLRPRKRPSDVCNSVGRALVNNAGIASGPQVGVNSDRMPPVKTLSRCTMENLAIHVRSDVEVRLKPSFFQPKLNVAELMAVFENSLLADEYSSIPAT